MPEKNNRTVNNSICDLFLCPSCEASRFPPVSKPAIERVKAIPVDKRSPNGSCKQTVNEHSTPEVSLKVTARSLCHCNKVHLNYVHVV